jgi:putative transposase
VTYQYKKDYSFKKGTYLSILTLEGRIVVPYTGYDKHIALIQKDAQIGAAKLWYDKPKKQFSLLVSLEIDMPDPTPETHKSCAGVDVGVRYLAVASNTRGNHSFHSGKQVVAKVVSEPANEGRYEQIRTPSQRLVPMVPFQTSQAGIAAVFGYSL